ncbi:MAG: selenium metabolism-associated LysR family transcriptional regulator [Desulfobacteraceae bacterium]
MDLWQLQIFCKVIELKSFSKAGQAVHISQPTVSSHIKDLEEHFSTQLLDRMSRQVFPTKAGELLYDYAHRLIALRNKTEAAMAELTGQIRGRITIGGSTIPGGYLLPQVIGIFSNAFPEVRISMVVGDTSEILDKTISGHIEVSVVGALAKEKILTQSALVDDEMGLVVPRGHKWAKRKRIKLQELIEEPLIIREPGSGTLKSLESALQKKKITIGDLNIIAEMGSTEAVRQAIKCKVGISILSAIAVSEECRSGQLKVLKIEELDLKRHFYLTTHRQRSPSPLCRAFIDFITRNIDNIR